MNKMYSIVDGIYAQQVQSMNNSVENKYAGAFPDSPPELAIRALEIELESIKKDNANLIEMNFNLEQQYSAIKEDLDQANDDCSDWEDAYHRMEDKVQELLTALNSIEEIAQNR
jgi:predicted  nucleic acid-binding Zn-ribbon protein